MVFWSVRAILRGGEKIGGPCVTMLCFAPLAFPSSAVFSAIMSLFFFSNSWITPLCFSHSPSSIMMTVFGCFTNDGGVGSNPSCSILPITWYLFSLLTYVILRVRLSNFMLLLVMKSIPRIHGSERLFMT